VRGKLLVLSRECGFALEPAALQVESLFEPAPGDARPLAAQLPAADAAWRARVAIAEARGERLVVLARVDADGGRIRVAAVPANSDSAACCRVRTWCACAPNCRTRRR
jgi:hypothetical protein